MLRVDAAIAGVGAVLLVQLSEDPEDLAPVAYFSSIYDGAQGAQLPDWREAFGLLSAVRHFYVYLDGCKNLIIETDATAALGLFTHPTKYAGDNLMRFRAELASLGVHQKDIVHRPGVSQLTADWPSRALERQRPAHVAKT